MAGCCPKSAVHPADLRLRGAPAAQIRVELIRARPTAAGRVREHLDPARSGLRIAPALGRPSSDGGGTQQMRQMLGKGLHGRMVPVAKELIDPRSRHNPLSREFLEQLLWIVTDNAVVG